MKRLLMTTVVAAALGVALAQGSPESDAFNAGYEAGIRAERQRISAMVECGSDSDCLLKCSIDEGRLCDDEDIFGPPCEVDPERPWECATHTGEVLYCPVPGDVEDCQRIEDLVRIHKMTAGRS